MKYADTSYYYVFICYIFLANMFDYITTYLVLQAGGTEINYLFGFVNSNTLVSWISLLVIKLLFVVAICFLYVKGWKHDKIITTSVMYSAATMLFMAGIHNLLILRHLI